MLNIEQNCSSVVFQGNETTSHLLVRKLVYLFAGKQEISRIVIQVEPNDIAVKDTVQDL